MTREQFEQYWEPARDSAYFTEKVDVPEWDGDGSRERAALMVKLLRLELSLVYYKGGDWADIDLTPELKDTLIKLAGPHGYAIAKALEARCEETCV